MKIGVRQADSTSNADPRHMESVDRLYALMRGQEWQGALDHLDAMDMPTGYVAYHRGVALGFMGRHAEALACFGSALETHPNPAPVYAWVGTILASLGRHAEAIRNYDRALKLGADDFATYYGKGIALLLTKEYGPALICLERALANTPDQKNIHLNMGVALESSG